MLFNEKDPETEKMKAFAASCKPLEELLDSVRDIDGFPIGKDEDILALSDAPWYTACPNPYIKDFIAAFGKPYDEVMDTYERKPFVHDISEGKNDPIYNVHSYHTKVPHKAIMPFIEHYTEEGDIVFDGFCGTGMTGVAARILSRKAILCDLSPIASYIAYNYNSSINEKEFQKEAKNVLKEIESECLWMYETLHHDKKTKGIINYVVWSDVLICPDCKNEYVFWDRAVDIDNGKMNDEYYCPYCKSLITKKDSEKAMTTFFDSAINQKITQINQVPILINYSIGNKRYEKTPDRFDLELIKKIEESSIPYWYPTSEIPKGDKTVEPLRVGITHVHHFYTKRNLWVLAAAFNRIKNHPIQLLKNWLTSSMIRTTKMYKFTLDRKMGTLNGTLYLPSLWTENSPFKLLKNKLNAHEKVQMPSKNTVIVQCTSSTNLSTIPSNCVDYVFTDPPFGGNLMYSELNFLWESWLKITTNNVPEAIINSSQNKGLIEYKDLMISTFKEMYRILKPNRWITVEFHNTKPSVWNAIQDSLSKAGFIVAQVTVLDKKQGSFNQVGAPGSVQNDLIINAYKEKKEFHQKFLKKAGEFLERDFIEDYLEHLPIEPNIGRSEKMLFSKLLAHYVKDGYEIRLDSKQFYELLKENFKIIDGYWFKDDEISEYEEWKKANGLQAIEEIAKKQLTLFINDEKSSIIWLYNFLETPKTYNDLLTAYNQAITKIDDEIPELRELLDTNFIFENRMYRRPLTDKERAEKEEKNEKELLKSFDKFLLQARSSSKKIKSIRKEAIKLGFTRAYKEKRFEDILVVAKKLDKDILENNSEINDFVEIARVKTGEL